jgi:hypothetical protein
MSTRQDRYSLLITLPIIAAISSSGTAQAGTPSDACSLLTAPQVSSALGAAVGQGHQLMPTSATVCSWTEQGGAAGSARNVTVSLITVKSFDSAKVPVSGVTKTPVSGIGDDAYFTEPQAMTAALSVKKGDTCFQVRSRTNPDSSSTGKTPASEQKDQEVDRALALEILKKL